MFGRINGPAPRTRLGLVSPRRQPARRVFQPAGLSDLWGITTVAASFRNLRRMRIALALPLGALFVLSSTWAVFANGPSFVDKLRQGPGAVNHPVHIRPTSNVTIPEGWPLDADGAITCTTCHTRVPSLRGGEDPQLRGFQGDSREITSFCGQCHRADGPRSAVGMHWMALRRAHISEGSPDREGSLGGQLDAESRRCMECHDGVTAQEFANSTPWTRGRGNLGDRRRNHPVGVPYTRGPSHRANASMHLEALLPAAVRLPNGVVGCVSYHNLHTTERYRLTAPIEWLNFCFTCHDMD